MNVLGLGWLFVRTERAGRGRLVGVSVGVAFGVALMLLVIAAYHGMVERNERSTWTYIGGEAASLETTDPLPDNAALAVSSGLQGASPEVFDGRTITRVDVAASPGTTLRIPGVDRIPRPGEFVASPELARLISEHPEDQLGDRFGTEVGSIADVGLAGPDALVAVVGASEKQLAGRLGVLRVSAFDSFAFPSDSYRMISLVGGFAVLFPVAVLIVILTRLGQAARAERIATMRLIGAPPARLAALAAAEIGLPSLVGAFAGIGVFWALRPVAAQVPVEGMRFFTGDLAVTAGTQVLVAAGMAALACAIAYVTAIRAEVGPLGASRERSERRPRAIALLPLALGAVLLAAVVLLPVAGWSLPYSDELLLVGFVLLTAGLLTAGPYLTERVSRAGAARGGSPSAVLALNRIVRHPRATFRAVSGMVLALFVVTTFAVGATTERGADFVDAPATERIAPDMLIARLMMAEPVALADIREPLAALSDVPGVVDAVLVSAPRSEETASGEFRQSFDGLAVSAEGAQQLGVVGFDADPEASYYEVTGDYLTNAQFASGVAPAPRPLPVEQAADSYPAFVLVRTEGGVAATERARTALETVGLPLDMAPTTRTEDAEVGSYQWAAKYSVLAGIGVLIAAAISAISLAVSTASGIIDRRRVLGLLRLTGAPARLVRRMLVVETAVPLLAVIVPSVGLGWLAAWALVAGLSQGERSVSVPDPWVFGVLAGCLALVAAAVGVAFAASRPGRGAAQTRFE